LPSPTAKRLWHPLQQQRLVAQFRPPRRRPKSSMARQDRLCPRRFSPPTLFCGASKGADPWEEVVPASIVAECKYQFLGRRHRQLAQLPSNHPDRRASSNEHAACWPLRSPNQKRCLSMARLMPLAGATIFPTRTAALKSTSAAAFRESARPSKRSGKHRWAGRSAYGQVVRWRRGCKIETTFKTGDES